VCGPARRLGGEALNLICKPITVVDRMDGLIWAGQCVSRGAPIYQPRIRSNWACSPMVVKWDATH
jgi:hypothetical protein